MICLNVKNDFPAPVKGRRKLLSDPQKESCSARSPTSNLTRLRSAFIRQCRATAIKVGVVPNQAEGDNKQAIPFPKPARKQGPPPPKQQQKYQTRNQANETKKGTSSKQQHLLPFANVSYHSLVRHCVSPQVGPQRTLRALKNQSRIM